MADPNLPTTSVPAPNEPDDDTTPFDDEQTGRAIDDIIAKEGDEVLAAEDQKRGTNAVVKHRNARGGFVRVMLHTKAFWWTVTLLALASAGAAAAIPTSRYWVLNTAGVKTAASVVAVDDTTGLPVKGVQLSIQGKTADSDENGKASLTDLKLGPVDITIEQPGFERITRQVTLGWGSNPLGTYKLKAAGVSYVIEVRDFLSNKPIQGVQAISGGSTAVSDKSGKITINLERVAATDDTVTLSKDGYRTDDIAFVPDPKQATKASLVINKKTIYVTKQSGMYDVYKSDVDGKNAQVLLPGTGSETSNISLAISPDGSKAAVVATRDNKRDAAGLLLSSLVVIDMNDDQATVVTRSAQLQLIDWIGSRIIFQQVSSDPATPPANRYAVIAYNTADNTRIQLAAARKINVVFSAQGSIYYAVAADAADTAIKGVFTKVKPDGTGRLVVADAEVWGGHRVDYNTFSLQTANEAWMSFTISEDKVSTTGGPISFVNRLYADNTTRNASLWVETANGQGKLQLYTVQSAKDRQLVAQGGLTYPVRWLTDSVAVYRIVLGGEVADYAVSTEGGTPIKIADVVNTYGFTSGQ